MAAELDENFNKKRLAMEAHSTLRNVTNYNRKVDLNYCWSHFNLFQNFIFTVPSCLVSFPLINTSNFLTDIDFDNSVSVLGGW
jgi:hypothetical protein